LHEHRDNLRHSLDCSLQDQVFAKVQPPMASKELALVPRFSGVAATNDSETACFVDCTDSAGSGEICNFATTESQKEALCANVACPLTLSQPASRVQEVIMKSSSDSAGPVGRRVMRLLKGQ